MSTHLISIIIAVLLMLPGFVGVFLPALPGIPYMFLVALAFVAVDQFQHLSGWELVGLLGLTIVSVMVDYFSGTLGAKFGGASTRATTAGMIGMLAGLFLFPPLGGLIGMFIAVLYVELQGGTLHKALRAAGGSLAGSLAGILVNLLLALSFIILFIFLAEPFK